jgi:hypothetical protein
LSGKEPSWDNPTVVAHVPLVEDSAFAHLDSRGSTEWNASSGYYILTGHTEGNHLAYIRNYLLDEVKHATIIGGARAYLLGDRPNNRLAAHIKKAMKEFKEQAGTRGGGNMVTNPVTVIEAIWTHVLVEMQMRKYISTIPLRTLRAVFEFDVPEYTGPKKDIDPAEQKRLDDLVAKNTEIRKNLGRWTPSQRKAALEQEKFEADHASMIEKEVIFEFGGFAGAEVPDSPIDLAVRDEIAARFPTAPLMRKVLVDRLRDYQIRNNRFVRENAKEKQEAAARK